MLPPMSVIDDLNQLIAAGRLTFQSEALKHELLGLPPAVPPEQKVQALVVALCRKSPTTSIQISSLRRPDSVHHAAGRAVDIGNEEIAGTLLPLVGTQEFVNANAIDELIFDATLIPGEGDSNKYNFDGGVSHDYNDATIKKHRNHIHFAVRA